MCNLEGTTTAHLTALTPDVRGALVAGFEDGKIQPAVWKKCVKTLEGELPVEERATLLDDIRTFARTHPDLAGRESFELRYRTVVKRQLRLP